MKHINLVSKVYLFPLPLNIQKNIVKIIFAFFIIYASIEGYILFNQIKVYETNINTINLEMNQLKQQALQKKSLMELKKTIEKEFSMISSEYELLTKKSSIKSVFENLSMLTPNDLWVTNLEIQYDQEKVVKLSGKSFKKNDVFTFMKNLNSIGKQVDLINLLLEQDGIYSFELKVELP